MQRHARDWKTTERPDKPGLFIASAAGEPDDIDFGYWIDWKMATVDGKTYYELVMASDVSGLDKQRAAMVRDAEKSVLSSMRRMYAKSGKTPYEFIMGFDGNDAGNTNNGETEAPRLRCFLGETMTIWNTGLFCCDWHRTPEGQTLGWDALTAVPYPRLAANELCLPGDRKSDQEQGENDSQATLFLLPEVQTSLPHTAPGSAMRALKSTWWELMGTRHSQDKRLSTNIEKSVNDLVFRRREATAAARAGPSHFATEGKADEGSWD